MTRTSTSSRPAPQVLKPLARGPGLAARLLPAGGASQRVASPLRRSRGVCPRPDLSFGGVPGRISEARICMLSDQPKPTPNVTPLGCYRFSCPKAGEGRGSLSLGGVSVRGSSITVASVQRVKCSGERGCVPTELRGRPPCAARHRRSEPFPRCLYTGSIRC